MTGHLKTKTAEGGMHIMKRNIYLTTTARLPESGTVGTLRRVIHAMQVGAVLAGACFAPSSRAIHGIEGTFEFACDAPWRIEPRIMADGTREYGAIPIQISIHDAMHAGLDDIANIEDPGTNGVMTFPLTGDFAAVVSLGSFHSVVIRELTPPGATKEYAMSELFELEGTSGAWPADSNLPAPRHRLCRLWAGDDPERFRNLSSFSEWHAGLWYVPHNKTPGTSLLLEIEVRLKRDPWPRVDPEFELPVPTPGGFIRLRNVVRVHLAANPLPRFDNRWLYGDLHYHSQGTDNEGESAYNYRGVVRAIGAMGLDYVVAADHASSSDQTMDVDLDVSLLEEFVREGLGIELIELLTGDRRIWLEEGDSYVAGGVLRDMDARRYAHCHGLIYANNGANREASLKGYAGQMPQNVLSYGVVPQVILGGEVDAIPEVNPSVIGELPQSGEPAALWRPHLMPFGNGRYFDAANLANPGIVELENGMHPYRMFESVDNGSSYLVRDFQGLESRDLYGREHLVYLPGTSALEIGSETTFVPSYTSDYGGATRRLDRPHLGKDALLPEIERKGVAFVAHHLSGCAECSSGPDFVPWTQDHMLLKAFRSSAILGLQFWNEDGRYRSKICSPLSCKGNDNYLGQEVGYERYTRVATPGGWYRASMALPVAEVRYGFLDGHFSLEPFAVPSGLWQEPLTDIEHSLHHGAYDWDMMNLRGLDPEQTRELTWLPPGHPRRVFMGGGSDAHGDLSYRRAGYLLGANEANDTAIGKPRNLVYVGLPEGPLLSGSPDVAPMAFNAGPAPGNEGVAPPDPALYTTPNLGTIRPHTQEQIIRALRRGRYCVTDGPALRIAIDVNGNQRIDDDDVQMGDVYEFDKLPRLAGQSSGQTLAVLVECLTTPEFGPIRKIDLYVGVHPGTAPRDSWDGAQARVYAPADHGVRDKTLIGIAGPTRDPLAEPTGGLMADSYWHDPRLTASPNWNNDFRFTAVFVIDLDSYHAGPQVIADRFFVRAFAETSGDSRAQKPNRYAFTNPIWLLRSEPKFALPDPAPPVIDIAIFYTTAARQAAGSVTAMEAAAHWAVDGINHACINSRINARFNLLRATEVAYTERGAYGDWTRLVNRDPALAAVVQGREDCGADLACLFVAGEAADPWPCSGAIQNIAYPNNREFSVVNWQEASRNFGLAHIVGHHLGCNHENPGDCAVTNSARAWRFTGYSGTNWGTIMTSPGETGVVRIPYFSNPNVSFDGWPTGFLLANNAAVISAGASQLNFRRRNSLKLTFLSVKTYFNGTSQFRLSANDSSWYFPNSGTKAFANGSTYSLSDYVITTDLPENPSTFTYNVAARITLAAARTETFCCARNQQGACVAWCTRTIPAQVLSINKTYNQASRFGAGVHTERSNTNGGYFEITYRIDVAEPCLPPPLPPDPTLTQQPSNTITFEGWPFFLSAAAFGSPPLSYRWLKDGLVLSDGGRVSGVASPTLMVANAGLADEGEYALVVTNSSGTVTSQVARVRVGNPPQIVQQPASWIDSAGSTGAFGVVVAGTEPMSFRWSKNGIALADGAQVSGAASSRLVLHNIVPSDAGAYSVLVSNAFGTATSRAAILTVLSPILVPSNAVWRYLDNGADSGTAWRQPGFDDRSWASGPAPLGYGDGDEATVVDYGADQFNKHVATYFRHAFDAGDPSAIGSLRLRLQRDDGAIVYLNGIEVFRSNLPEGPVDYRTLAYNAIDDGTAAFKTSLDPVMLAVGVNVLAVEVHQVDPRSSDLSFALELAVSPPLGPPPGLAIRLGPPNGGVNTVVLSWPSPSTGYVLQQTATMTGTGGGWTDVTQLPVVVGAFKEVTLPAVGSGCMFRLRRP